MQKLRLSPYNIFLLILILLNLLPILAPIMLKLAESSDIFLAPAKAVYFVYSFTCHQFHHRSLHLYDYQIAWCARDMGIWFGFLAAALGVKYGGLRKLKWYWVIPFAIPIALDGGIQTIATVLEVPAVGAVGDPIYISNNFMRFVTGALFGLGVSLWVSGVMQEAFGEDGVVRKFRGVIKRYSVRLGGVIVILIAVYIALIGLWRSTSTHYLPSDSIDSAVKTPKNDFFKRRENAICPSEGLDLFSFDCFLR